MAGERLPARFSLRSQLWFRWIGKCFETATSHMQTVAPWRQSSSRVFGIFEGLGIAMLSVDSLLAIDDARSAVLAPPTFWLPQDTLLREAVGLTPHPQGGWWIITHGLVDNDRWHVMRLTADTLIQRSDQFAEPPTVRSDNYGVNINFSPRGDRFILKGGSAGNSLYDFDVQTG